MHSFMQYVANNQVNQSLSAICLLSTFQIKHGFVHPQTTKKKGLTERIPPRYGIDRLRVLRKREADAKAWDRLPAKGIRVEPKNVV